MSDLDKLREKRCICWTKYHKRTAEKPLPCTCSASVLGERFLKDFAVGIVPLTADYIKKERALLDKNLLFKSAGFGSYSPSRSSSLARSAAHSGLLASKEFHQSEPSVSSSGAFAQGQTISTLAKSTPEIPLDQEIPEEDRLPQSESSTKSTVSKEQPGEVPIESSDTSKGKGVMATVQSWIEAVNQVAADMPDTCISEAFLEVYEAFLETFEYKGFDVEKIRQTFANRMASKFRPGTCIEIGKKKVEFGSPKSTSSVVCFLVSLFNLRGTNLTAISDGLEGETKSGFKALASGLQLQSKVSQEGKAKSSETLTLARLACAFPLQAVMMATNDKSTRKVINMSEVGLSGDTGLFKAIMHPMCASLLTPSMVLAGFHFVTFLASFKLNQLIGGKTKAGVDRLWLFHKAALNSKAANDKQKTSLWTRLELNLKDSDMMSIIQLSKEGVKPLVGDKLYEEMEAFTL